MAIQTVQRCDGCGKASLVLVGGKCGDCARPPALSELCKVCGIRPRFPGVTECGKCLIAGPGLLAVVALALLVLVLSAVGCAP